jgi:hypothetical protein
MAIKLAAKTQTPTRSVHKDCIDVATLHPQAANVVFHTRKTNIPVTRGQLHQMLANSLSEQPHYHDGAVFCSGWLALAGYLEDDPDKDTSEYVELLTMLNNDIITTELVRGMLYMFVLQAEGLELDSIFDLAAADSNGN